MISNRKFEKYLKERAEKDMDALLTEKDLQFIHKLVLEAEEKYKKEREEESERKKRKRRGIFRLRSE